MNILVTGGAGYIGSAAVKRLLEEGHSVTVVDNLYKGRIEYVDPRAIFKQGDILDIAFLDSVFSASSFDALMHFAALKDAGESMTAPEIYSSINIGGTINLLNIAKKYGVKKFIYSSSAATYGEVPGGIADEAMACKPTNYYGYTKLAGEELLKWYQELAGIEYVALRYFNVAGDAGLGYIDPKAKNIFNIIAEVATGKRPELQVFGNDYDTPDGTGIRDYVHVSDLVDAHIKALALSGGHILNIGTEKGYTVLEIVKGFERISGKTIPLNIVPRRPGDVAKLTASYEKAKEKLGWQPTHAVEDMVKSTWDSYNR